MNSLITNKFNSSSQLLRGKNKVDNEKHFSHVADWRIISSGVVTRTFDRSCKGPADSQSSSPPSLKDSVTLESNFIKHSQMMDALRKPTTYQKARKLLNEGNNEANMTRNCEQLFSQMKSSFSLPKQKNDVDPSLSVRRIVKGSGLLGAFGPGLLDNNEDDYQGAHNEQVNNQTSDYEYNLKAAAQPFDVDAFINASAHPSQTRTTDLWQSAACVNEDEIYEGGLEFENLANHSSQPSYGCFLNPSPIMYDTVLMQKTIETEVVEYLPYEHDNISSPLKRSISGKEKVFYTPGNKNVSAIREQRTEFANLPKFKKQFFVSRRDENSSQSSDFENESYSSGFY